MFKSIIISGMVFFSSVFSPNQALCPQPTLEIAYEDEYIYIPYMIVEIKGNEYFGFHSDGTGIYFLEENIYPGSKFKVGDEVIAVFAIEDDLVTVMEVDVK